MYVHLKRGLWTIISQNYVHHIDINHNKGIKMKWQGLVLHRFSCLLSQGSLISSVFVDFNDMTRAQYRVDDPNLCLHHRLAPHPHDVDELTSWEQKTYPVTPHKRTCSLWTLHDHCMVFVLQLFNGDLFRYFEILPFPWWNDPNK